MSCSCFACFTGPCKFVYLVLEHLKCSALSTILSHSQYGCSTWHLMANSEDLRIRIVAIRSSVTAWNWLTVQWPGSYRGSPRRVSLGTGLARVDQISPCAVRQLQKLASKNRIMSAASIALEVAEVEGQRVSAQTTHCNKSVCMAVVPEGSLFWSWLTKKPENSLLKTTWPRAWITGTMSCGLMSLR